MIRSQSRIAVAICVAAWLLLGGVVARAEGTPPDLARALERLDRGDWTGALGHGRLAFGRAESDAMRYHAARVAAVASLSLGRPLATRFWLRRAGDVAPGPVETARVARNYRALQARSPWRARLDFGLRRTDNVNGGARSALNIIEGFPIAGVLSGRARALPGTIAMTQTHLSRRLHRGARSETRARLGLIDRRVKLDDRAKDIAPGVRSREFDQTELRLSLDHARAGTRAGWSTFGSLGLARNRYGRNPYFHAVDASLGQRMRLSERVSLVLRTDGRRKSYAAGGDGRTLGLGADLGYGLAGGGRLGVGLAVIDDGGPASTLDHRTRTAQVSYSHGAPVLGLRARVALGVSRADYDRYRVGVLAVPGGRRDTSLFGTLDLTWEAFRYAGFSPRVTLRAAETESNVSRFATGDVSVSFGISSAF